MIRYTITAKCDIPNCPAEHTAQATVLKPDTTAVPYLASWGGPFAGWRFAESQPTLCPEHARQQREADDAAKLAEEESTS